jgi:hypothetical protein
MEEVKQPFDKSGLKYEFGKIFGEEQWQVRLKGEFLMYAYHNKADLIDQEMQQEGFSSRRDVLDWLIEDSIQQSMKNFN